MLPNDQYKYSNRKLNVKIDLEKKNQFNNHFFILSNAYQVNFMILTVSKETDLFKICLYTIIRFDVSN